MEVNRQNEILPFPIYAMKFLKNQRKSVQIKILPLLATKKTLIEAHTGILAGEGE